LHPKAQPARSTEYPSYSSFPARPGLCLRDAAPGNKSAASAAPRALSPAPLCRRAWTHARASSSITWFLLHSQLCYFRRARPQECSTEYICSKSWQKSLECSTVSRQGGPPSSLLTRESRGDGVFAHQRAPVPSRDKGSVSASVLTSRAGCTEELGQPMPASPSACSADAATSAAGSVKGHQDAEGCELGGERAWGAAAPGEQRDSAVREVVLVWDLDEVRFIGSGAQRPVHHATSR
jgi:hypothetical protein